MVQIYQTRDYGDAQIRIAVVQDPAMADLWVYTAQSLGLAYGEAIWFINRDRYQADVRAVFTSLGAADLAVHFVRDRGQAGWQRPHRLKGKLWRRGF